MCDFQETSGTEMFLQRVKYTKNILCLVIHCANNNLTSKSKHY